MFVVVFLGNTCGKDENKHNSIDFKNNINRTIFVHGKWWYPDTTISFGNPAEAGEYYKVAAKASGNPLMIMDTYEDRFKQHDTFMILVFDALVLETTPWDTVKAKYLVLKRYDLSLDDLKNMNWTISYP
jgi:hypothetical protein